ncbi:sterol desaturase family protein [Halomonas sp. KAO]|uniref:sterol desaturase family protein n=1 Tax=Halomonas sp. KAO TaxID=2783858 RepID=UPI00189FF95E|nr:sterol desaturase family protein [Halomonas sp. KAO]MBF7053025.1 sterol desaturase family protein [Halomonas sp. KAO]
MPEGLLQHEPWLRLVAFAGVLLAMAGWELVASRRPQRVPRRRRWPANLMIVVVDTLALRLVFPLAAVGVALAIAPHGWGMMPWLGVPWWLSVPLCVLALDVVIYFQHRLFHAVPWLWRLHRMHHADLEIDVTTGLRFHPLEILLSMLLKVVVVLALGAPAVAVLLFEVILNASSLFNHANVRLSSRLDRWLRWLVVTPDMHRVHHSWRQHETDSNFGFNLSWWDRLFGTYRAQPEEGHLGMTIGLKIFRDPRELRLGQMLTQPFRRPVPQPEGKPISRE